MFLGVYHKAVDAFLDTQFGQPIHVCCSWLSKVHSFGGDAAHAKLLHYSERPIDVSLSAYADDLARKRMLTGLSQFVASSET